MPNVGVPEVDQLLNDGHRVFAGRCRIAGPVRQEHAVRLEGHDVFGRGFGRHHCHLAAGTGEQAENVALNAVVDRDHVEFRIGLPRIALVPAPWRLVPGEALATRHHRHEIHADQTGPLLRFFLERGKIKLAIRRMRDHCIGHAVDTNQRGERARIDPGQPDDAAGFEPVVEIAGRPIVRRRGDCAVQDDAARTRRRRHIDGFDVVLVGADIADMRKGKRDDLPGVGRVGEDFLVTRHGGVEADLADRMSGRAEPEAFEYGSVSQHQKRGRLGLSPSLARSPGGGGFRLGHGLLLAYYSVRGKGPPAAAPRQI